MATTNAYRAAILATSGLVSYWRFGEAPGSGTAVDENSAANDGTYHGSPALDYGSPLLGDTTGSIKFDGSDDYITIANESNFDFEHTDKWSFEFWIWMPSGLGSSGDYTIYSKRNGGSPYIGYDLNIRIAGSKIGFSGFICTNGASTYLERYMHYNAGIATNRWHHIVLTWGGSDASADTTASRMKLYINGTETAEYFNSTKTLTSGSTTILNDYTPTIGKAAAGTAAQYLPNGAKIKDFQIYNVELSSATIAAHYAAASDVSLDYTSPGAIVNGGPLASALLSGDADVYLLVDSISGWDGDPASVGVHPFGQYLPDKLLSVGVIASIRGRYCKSMSSNPNFDESNTTFAPGDDAEAINGTFAGATNMPTHGAIVVFNADAADDEYVMSAGTAGLSAECPASTTRVRFFLRNIPGATALPESVIVTSWRGFAGVSGNTLTTTKGPEFDLNLRLVSEVSIRAVDIAAADTTGTVLGAIQGNTGFSIDETVIMHQGLMTYDSAGSGVQFLELIGDGGYKTEDFYSDSAGAHRMATGGIYGLVEFFRAARLSRTCIVFDCTGVNDAAASSPGGTWGPIRQSVRNRFAYIADQAGYRTYIHVYVHGYRPSTVLRTLWDTYASLDAAIAVGNDAAIDLTAVIGKAAPEHTITDPDLGVLPFVYDNVHPGSRLASQTLADWFSRIIDTAVPVTPQHLNNGGMLLLY